jgi:mannose-6-phosphate isomerase-like protein (cupin superfamily)
MESACFRELTRHVVAEDEMWLTCGGQTRHLRPGDTFHIACGTPHSERYGPQGATY